MHWHCERMSDLPSACPMEGWSIDKIQLSLKRQARRCIRLYWNQSWLAQNQQRKKNPDPSRARRLSEMHTVTHTGERTTWEAGAATDWDPATKQMETKPQMETRKTTQENWVERRTEAEEMTQWVRQLAVSNTWAWVQAYHLCKTKHITRHDYKLP